MKFERMEAGRDTRCKSRWKKENIMESEERERESAKRKEPEICFLVYAYASLRQIKRR